MKVLFNKYLKDTSGNFAIMASLFSGALILIGGAVIETSRMVSAKSELQGMADAAALELAGSL